MSIRVRLTLWFALIIGLILVVAGMFFYSALRLYAEAEVESDLRVYSTLANASLSGDFGDPIDYRIVSSRLPPMDDLTSPGIYVQLVDGSGNVVVRSDNLGDQVLPTDAWPTGGDSSSKTVVATIASGENGDVRTMIMASTLNIGGQPHLLEVAQSLAPIDNVLARVGFFLVMSILLILVLAVLSGAFLIRRALAPVRRITGTARGIESSADLSQRVGYRGPRDEIGQLATTFDHMIDRLDRALKSQRNFVADASHELRGPLTIIQGNLDLLKRNLGEEDRRESIRALEVETARMSKIVADLLVLAELDSGQAEPKQMISLRDVLLDAESRAKQLAGNRQLAIGRQEDLWVTVDAHRLEQVLNNLVDNAIRYTPEGGAITLSLFREGDWARLEVADTGIGISSDQLPHVFDRFYRVDKARSRAKGGTGLGLAIVKGIVEQHGGKVTVTSQLGKGSTFTVWLKL